MSVLSDAHVDPGNASFWRDRFARFGHTGWASRTIYVFDQHCRLQLFDAMLKARFARPGVALDFGCGSGDFSRLLLDRGWTVVGYDPFVEPRLQHPRFSYTQDLGSALQGPPCDLVVSVTALDHCVHDDEFAARLTDIAAALRPGGRFWFLEYAVDAPRERNHYQSFRTIEAWRAFLASSAFNLDEVEPYFHPDAAPVDAWLRYRGAFLTKALAVAERLSIPGAEGWRAAWLRRVFDRQPYHAPASSPLKVLSGQRSD